jgi:hypothetical protein
MRARKLTRTTAGDDRADKSREFHSASKGHSAGLQRLTLSKRERERERERERPRRCVKGSRTVRRGGARDGGRRGKNDACNARYFHALTAEENNGYGRAPANATVKRLTSETSEQAARNAIPPPLVDDRSEGDGRLISHSSAKYDGNERHVGTKPE